MFRTFSRPLLLAGAWAVFVGCCVAPIAWMFLASLGSSHLTAASLGDARLRELMANTIAIGLGVVLTSAAIGLPLGIVLGRCAPGRIWLPRLLLVIPLVIPSYVAALVWMILFSNSISEWARGPRATILVLGFSLYPLMMLATEASLRSMSSRAQEAGWLVASPTRVWLGVIGPLMLPPVVASSLLVFVIAISDFAVPSLLRTRVYTTEVFTAFAALYDSSLATIVAIPLIAAAMVAAFAAVAFMGRPLVPRVERSDVGAMWPTESQRAAAIGTGVTGAVSLAAVTGILFSEAMSGRASMVSALSLAAIRNSVTWSAIAASLVVVFGSLLGYWRARTSWRGARSADASWAALFAVPATVLGVGIIALWNRPGVGGAIYRSDAIIVIAYLGRFLPIGALLCAAFLQRVPRGVEDAAAASGASWARILRRVVIPMAKKGLAAVWLTVFMLAFGDVALAILLAPPGESTLPVRAYTLIANSPTGDVARLALAQLAATSLPLAALAFLFHRHDSPK